MNELRWGWVACALICASVLAGCEEDASAEKGGAGESCVRRDDCSGSLLCIDNRCVEPAGSMAVGDGGAAMQIETRGQAGESCTRRADCQTMLACVNQVCVAESTLTTAPMQVRGERGETCQARNDCLEGLACIGGRCRESEINVTVQTKECFRIECTSTDDCCDNFTPSSSCASYKTLCDGGDTAYCAIYDSNCTCQLACEDDLCVFENTCMADTDCGSLMCAGGKCVQCTMKSDCGNPDAECVGGLCTTGCKKNEDCALFEACQMGECVEVGCTSDRECLFATGDPLAKCVDKECVIPCMTDTECTMPFHACENSKCTFVGCESNEECRVLLGLENGLFGDEAMAVCREP
jgi:hypothetical protein